MFHYKYPPIINRKTLQESISLADEDFFYNDAVNMVDQDVLGFIFDARNSGANQRSMEFDYSWPYPVDPEVYDGEFSEIFYVQVTVQRNVPNLSGPVNVSGGALQNDMGFNTIEIDVEVGPGVNLEDQYSNIESSVRETLAHEMHHFTQTEPMKRIGCPELPNQQGDSHFDYFTSACEIPAFRVGFRSVSSKTGQPIESVIDDYLKNFEKIGFISQSESEKIKDTWKGFRFES